ncbi:MAG: hypothetical protein QOF83_4182 [Solirubrobacteraceae bacterium]|jgi:hypothetical protein|nr:hypothetical protein [Solirubrobacteraceae bacterium]
MTTTHRAGTGALLVLVLAASAGPAAATPNQLTPGGSQVVRTPHGAHAVLPAAATTRAAVQAAEASTPVSTPVSAPVSTPATIVHVTAPSGFDWGDAGIGAAGGLGLAIAGLGGALAVSQRHGHHTAGQHRRAAG